MEAVGRHLRPVWALLQLPVRKAILGFRLAAQQLPHRVELATPGPPFLRVPVQMELPPLIRGSAD
jgi:hypothetical protein